MYAIIEMQTAADGGTTLPPVVTKESRDEAWSAYYAVLSAAAVSAVPLHSATLLDGTGAALAHRCFTHGEG